MKRTFAILLSLLLFCNNLAFAAQTGVGGGWIDAAQENSVASNVFKLAGSSKTFTLLGSVDDEKHLILANESYGIREFSSDNSQIFDITNEANIGYWLNNDFISSDYTGEKLPENLVYYAVEHVWDTETGYEGSEFANSSGKIGLLSKTEFENNVNLLGTTDNLDYEYVNSDEYRFWWTRSPVSSISGKSISIGFSGLAEETIVSESRIIRPALYVDNSFFENVKLDTQYMGSTVKTLLNSLEISNAGYKPCEKEIILNNEQSDIVSTEVNANWSDSFYDKEFSTRELSFDLSFNNTSSLEHTKYYYWQINNSANTSQPQECVMTAGENKTVSVTLPIEKDGDYNIKIYISSDNEVYDVYNYDVSYIKPTGVKSLDKGYAGIGLTSGIAVDEKLELLEAAGVWTTRQSVYWNEIESTKGKYTWKKMDNYVKKAMDKGVEVIMPLGLINSLYRTTDENGNTVTMGSDEEINAFVNYAVALAKRYPQITRYEVWNEANANNFWPSAPSVENYIKMLKALSPALKAVNPDIEIIVGVTSNSEENTPTDDGSYWCINWKKFIGALLADDIQPYFDAVSIHTYYNNRTRADSSKKAHIKEITELVKSKGGFKKIYMTETGAYSGPNTYNKTEHEKACEIVRQFAIGDQYNLDGTWVYNFVNSGTDKSNTEHNYGSITNPDEGMRPMEAYYATKEYLARIDGTVYLGKKALSSNITGHLYANEEGAFLLAYAKSSTYTYSYNFGYNVEKYNLYGNKISEGNVAAFDGDPCYVTGISLDDVSSVFKGFVTEQLSYLSDEVSSDAQIENINIIIDLLSAAESADDYYGIIDSICQLGLDAMSCFPDALSARAFLHSINQICDKITDYLGLVDEALEMSYDDIVRAYNSFKQTIDGLSYDKDMGTWNIWNYALSELKSLVDEGEESICEPVSGEGYSLDKYGRLSLSGIAAAGDTLGIKIVNSSGEIVYIGAVTADSVGKYTFDTTITGEYGDYEVTIGSMLDGSNTILNVPYNESDSYVSFSQRIYYGKLLKNEKLLSLIREYLFAFGLPADGSTILADVLWKVDDNSASATLTLKNTGETRSGTLIIAAYDDTECLIDAKLLTKDFETLQTTRCEEITVNYTQKPCSIRVFLWSDMMTLVPIIFERVW